MSRDREGLVQLNQARQPTDKVEEDEPKQKHL